MRTTANVTCRSNLATRQQVRRWMRSAVGYYENATLLVEAADEEFDLPDGGLDNETHWVWDEAVDAIMSLEDHQ
ncbi:hypothetical protein [Acidithiobacillus caldus]|nr:hypothetical protein [Acidithiobacillus caldus]OFC35536.1 hypothetical protein BAE29_15395 [Acidithiobacillus caldus]OFC36385.1 hypothetical protein BAE27_06295 [Acidithiobacillus caldus]OFC40451.1 hypothetical protein BAE28_00115 [Acidithiobacillus caldus]OFC62180.1 hypothetical protein BAE30_02715 [Acidithiobacillus caldus]